MLLARGFRLNVACGYMPTMSSSTGVLGPRVAAAAYLPSSASTLSKYSDAKFSLLLVRRSPPLPLTQSTSTDRPVSGSTSASLALVLPPPVLVTRWSLPSRLDR